MENQELSHHGILGMKWGVRRYQNADGSLTPAGKRRQERQERKAEKKAQIRAKKVAAGEISAKDMTPEELRERVERLKLEKEYRTLIKDNKSYDGVSRFMDKFKDAAIDKVAEHGVADTVAQAVKAITVKLANSAFQEEVTYTNNKKKS